MGHMTATRPPAKARRTGGRSARVREAVLRATLDALLAGGSDDLSIREVAQRAGVHETSVYRRWGTRANLILDAVLSEVEAAVPVPDTGSLRGDLLALLSAIAAFITTPLGQVLRSSRCAMTCPRTAMSASASGPTASPPARRSSSEPGTAANCAQA